MNKYRWVQYRCGLRVPPLLGLLWPGEDSQTSSSLFGTALLLNWEQQRHHNYYSDYLFCRSYHAVASQPRSSACDRPTTNVSVPPDDSRGEEVLKSKLSHLWKGSFTNICVFTAEALNAWLALSETRRIQLSPVAATQRILRSFGGYGQGNYWTWCNINEVFGGEGRWDENKN